MTPARICHVPTASTRAIPRAEIIWMAGVAMACTVAVDMLAVRLPTFSLWNRRRCSPSWAKALETRTPEDVFGREVVPAREGAREGEEGHPRVVGGKVAGKDRRGDVDKPER